MPHRKKHLTHTERELAASKEIIKYFFRISGTLQASEGTNDPDSQQNGHNIEQVE